MCRFFKFILPNTLYSSTKKKSKQNNIQAFPKRQFYPHLNYINTETFANGLYDEEYDVIDVRDKESFNKLRIKSATHIFLKNKYFEQYVLDFSEQSEKQIVIYSSSLSCSKSYLASSKIKEIFKENNITNKIITYDSGISDIAYSHADLVLKKV
ncbi:MAG: rhodanese-like domain-containing protein [Gammaproteobacteria bacterium]|nr:rhodanese-like domain-containing protein [Gammaproteobacteria bacterium]